MKDTANEGQPRDTACLLQLDLSMAGGGMSVSGERLCGEVTAANVFLEPANQVGVEDNPWGQGTGRR